MFEERVELARQLEEQRWQEANAAARAVEDRVAELEGRLPLYRDVPRRSVKLGRSRGTLQNGLTCLRACLTRAVALRYISENPAAKIELPRGQAPEMRVLTSEQVGLLLAAASREERSAMTYPVILTAVGTGVRRGELFALRWRDFDQQRRRLWVRRNVNRWGEFQEPKTRGSVRAIGIPKELVAALLEHKMAAKRKGDDDLIFANTNGSVVDAGNFVRREFKPALRAAKVPVVRFHDLRHTFASLLIARNVSPKAISEALGHASVQITLDRYSHLYDDARGDAGDAMQAALFGPPAATLEAVQA
jgi:integrase